MHWALIAECLTCLKPFLQTWHEGIPSGNDQPQYWGALSNTTSNLSAAGRKRNLGDLRAKNSTGDQSDDGGLRLRSDLPFFLTKIGSDRTRLELRKLRTELNYFQREVSGCGQQLPQCYLRYFVDQKIATDADIRATKMFFFLLALPLALQRSTAHLSHIPVWCWT